MQVVAAARQAPRVQLVGAFYSAKMLTSIAKAQVRSPASQAAKRSNKTFEAFGLDFHRCNLGGLHRGVSFLESVQNPNFDSLFPSSLADSSEPFRASSTCGIMFVCLCHNKTT